MSQKSSALVFQCAYHKELNITNFCQFDRCYIPLCPECVKIHQIEHLKRYTYP